jgi:hypothetical protein
MGRVLHLSRSRHVYYRSIVKESGNDFLTTKHTPVFAVKTEDIVKFLKTVDNPFSAVTTFVSLTLTSHSVRIVGNALLA